MRSRRSSPERCQLYVLGTDSLVVNNLQTGGNEAERDMWARGVCSIYTWMKQLLPKTRPPYATVVSSAHSRARHGRLARDPCVPSQALGHPVDELGLRLWVPGWNEPLRQVLGRFFPQPRLLQPCGDLACHTSR